MALNDPRTHDPDLPGENPHYVRAVTEFGEQAEVLAAEDIYASNGMKLVAKGARIGRHQFEHLTNHKLAAPLDHSLCTDKPVDVASLALEAGKFIEQHPIYRRIAMRAGDPLAVKHALCSLKLPAPIQVRLSVMRARRTQMYEHSLRTAMVAFALARHLRLPEREHGPLLLACLCHDIGEMHTDPAILAIGHSICPAERRFVHVHPITSYVLVHELPGFPPAAAQAILHHHERLDGSGYPNDLPGPRIPALARLVAVADVAEAVIKRFDLPRVDMLFRLNQGRFDPGVVGALRDLIHVTPEDATEAPHEHGAARQLAHLAELLQAWFTLRAMLEKQLEPAPPDASPLAFLFDRMSAIRLLVLQAGFDPDNMPSMLAVAREDPAILMELRGMLDEMDWLLTDLANEIDRRSPELVGLSSGALNGLLGHLRPAARA
jgi:HD-GYP domain-containing protein (c-di-GMP phosphodiesterase class II)